MVGWSNRNKYRGPYLPLTPEEKRKDLKIITTIMISCFFIMAVLLMGNSHSPEKRAMVKITDIRRIKVGVPTPFISKILVILSSPNSTEMRTSTSDLDFPSLHKVGDSVEVSYFEMYFYGKFQGNCNVRIIK